MQQLASSLSLNPVTSKIVGWFFYTFFIVVSGEAYLFLCSSAVSDVPTINIDTTNKTKSFSKNWPGTTEIAGNPRDASKTPGVVSMNDNVVKKSPVESTPPKIASLGEKTRAAINRPTEISSTPRKFENP